MIQNVTNLIHRRFFFAPIASISSARRKLTGPLSLVQSNGLTGVDATSAQVSILSLTPGQTAVTNATAPAPAPGPGQEPPVGPPLAPAPAPVANNNTNHTKSAANGNRGVSFAAWALSVIATIAAGVAVL